MKPCIPFESLLAQHCAPTLSGIKPANLICCKETPTKDLTAIVAAYNDQLQSRGLSMKTICACDDRALVFVFRAALLKNTLSSPGAKDILLQCGYPQGGDLSNLLAHLELRMQQPGAFPHEIGLFLGYPLEDVLGFIHHKGKNYKRCGAWKVYGDADHSEALFARYSKCREIFSRHVARGTSILQLLGAL